MREKVQTGVILVAGKSSRFGGEDKNQYLIDFNIKLLQTMNVSNLIIVCNESNYKFYYKEYKNIAQIYIQDPSLYGPAAPVITIKDYLKQHNSPFYIILGDNYIKGPLIEDLPSDTAFVSYKEMLDSNDNLRLGFIEETGVIKEKPHGQTKGKFFIGYMAFHQNCLANLEKLTKSDRNEYEITEFYNLSTNKEYGLLDCEWFDITKKEDLELLKNI